MSVHEQHGAQMPQPAPRPATQPGAQPAIVIVGSLNADLVVRTERFPQPGQTVHGSDLTVAPGGKGANQAVAAARLGGRVRMLGAVGVDQHGTLLLDSLLRAGADTDRIRRVDGVATGTAIITVDDSGENTIVVSPGANGTLTADDVTASADLVDGAAVLGLCIEIDLAVVLAAARRAHEAGVTVLLNLSPSGPIPAELLELTDILLVNEYEAADLTGVSPTVDAAGFAAALAGHSIRRAVVTLGGHGALVLDADAAPAAGVVRVAAPRVHVVDTTGCGDAFLGALAVRIAAGASLAEAAREAVLVGSYAATGEGAQNSYPDRDQLAAFAAGHRANAAG